MSTIAPAPLLTTADLLALPDDGKDRWLIRGRLREKPMTKRNRFHAWIESRIDYFLWSWIESQPEPRGDVYSGEVGCILRHDPSTTVGIDVAYFSTDVSSRQTDDTTLVDGVPILAVEILSPNDTVEEIDEKVHAYLTAGVALLWIVNPRLRTVQVLRPDTEPVLFNVTQELSAEPHLPGFRVPVARLFPR
jgi:Uma2 family endonuclease